MKTLPCPPLPQMSQPVPGCQLAGAIVSYVVSKLIHTHTQTHTDTHAIVGKPQNLNGPATGLGQNGGWGGTYKRIVLTNGTKMGEVLDSTSSTVEVKVYIYSVSAGRVQYSG